MKSKLKGAQTGHDLLKRKSEALTKRFREIAKRIDEAKRKMGRVMQIAAFSLAEVTYATGNDGIKYQITESVRKAKFRVRTWQENVSGVFLPQFESWQKEGGSEFAMTGLGKGGQQVQKSRDTYTRAVETLVELASLQTAFVILDEVIKVVNRRVNAMYYTLIIRPALSKRRLLTVSLQRTRHHPTHRKHNQIHQLRARRTRQRRVLPSQKGQEHERTSCSGGGAREAEEEGRPAR